MSRVVREVEFAPGDRVKAEWYEGVPKVKGKIEETLDEDAGLYRVRFDNGMVTECFASYLELIEES